MIVPALRRLVTRITSSIKSCSGRLKKSPIINFINLKLNNMTTEVSYEIAQLLKEKGFDKLCDKKYITRCLWQTPNSREKYKNSEIHKNSSDITAPTIAQVIMWLYEKHEIWVAVDLDDDNTFVCVVRSKLEVVVFDNTITPTEAYLEAITHVLKHLI